ncbi:hypothetical protein [Neobacillus vireti]|uniref:Right handed beta helix domain-containing protein n=1 Tax=Neobacillus vireti LMG 21834 TaxID=1131730 RepID=A0AB94IQB1_9BACI|nr:hypothetical protein [Neobacillus vireti]ETI69158.1 hypothetical protein BAVI_08666 [Neobacillus vireti LMG 21834]KLT15538.1 hypothetical protein AA980_23110 [Neobacillus vireti]
MSGTAQLTVIHLNGNSFKRIHSDGIMINELENKDYTENLTISSNKFQDFAGFRILVENTKDFTIGKNLLDTASTKKSVSSRCLFAARNHL